MNNNSKPRGNILVAEAEKKKKSLLTQQLEKDGFQIIKTSNPKAIIEKIYSSEPDIIIIDIGLPDLIGSEVTELISDDPRINHIPLFIYGDKAQLNKKEAGSLIGVDEYITEPFDLKEMTGRIEVYVKSKQKCDELKRAVRELSEDRDKYKQANLRLNHVFMLNGLINSSMPVDEILAYTSSHFPAIIDIDHCLLYIRKSSEEGWHFFTEEDHSEDDGVKEITGAFLDDGNWREAVDDFVGDRIFSSDADLARRWRRASFLESPVPDVNFLMVPFDVQDESIKGYFFLTIASSRCFTDDDLNFIQTFIERFTVALRNRIRYETSLRTSLRDTVTGLYTSEYFEQVLDTEIRRVSRHRSRLTILLLDIDYFTNLNNIYGHEFCNRILRDVSKILTSMTRKSDFMSRIGSDSFALILPLTSRSGARRVANKIRRAVAELKYPVEGQRSPRITVSSGICPHRAGWDRKALMDHAHQMIKKAQESGRGVIKSYMETPMRGSDKSD